MVARRAVIHAVIGLSLSMQVGAGGAQAAPPGHRAGEEQVKALEQARQEAFVRGDIEFLDRQTAEDYTTINGTGALSTKPQMMQSLRAGTVKVQSFELAELRARMYGPVAILTGIYRDRSSVKGRERLVNARFTRTFVNEAGTWRAVAYQQTPIEPRP